MSKNSIGIALIGTGGVAHMHAQVLISSVTLD